MPIVGTAGHVDHGKSALVQALTGTNPDRWSEERIRGMTLDLGFARLVLDDGLEAAIVDVPGHERFLHNMLAGAAGMDALLLVVAADEGVKPQTREHLDILTFLNVRQTIVVVTKIDLLPSDMRSAAYANVVRALNGTFAAGAPLVGVSSVTGEGLSELRARIAAAVRALPPHDADAPVYLPIDRVFVLAGLGTVVTGTLMQGSIAVGDVLALEPSNLPARVRSIGAFDAAPKRVGPGSRVALNLPGIERAHIARGHVAVSKEFAARTSFRVRFTALPSAVPLLRRRTPVRAYLGAAEILGLLTFDRAPAAAEEARATLHLRQAAVAFPGVRFVVRRPSPKTLLGGGYVEAFEIERANDAHTPAQTAVLAVLSAAGLQPLEIGAVAFAANLREDAARDALETLAGRDEVVALQRPAAYLAAPPARALLGKVVECLESVVRTQPWVLGATSLALARELAVDESTLVRVLAVFVEHGRLARRSGYYATLDHEPALTLAQRELFDSLVPAGEGGTFVPMPFATVRAALKRAQVDGALAAFDTLLASGALVKVGDDLYRGSQIAAIRARVERHLHEHRTMTAAAFRDVLGTSRKYAVPLLEWLDAQGVTLRVGNDRVLRKASRGHQ